MTLLDSYGLAFLCAYYLPKLIVATLCGGIIGLERELKHRSAGLKTNVLICVGSTLFVSTGILVFTDSSDRVVAQIITGVGFLGAGAIFKERDKVKGLTTAAFIWVCSAIGIIVGCHGYILGVLMALGCVAISLSLSWVENKLL